MSAQGRGRTPKATPKAGAQAGRPAPENPAGQPPEEKQTAPAGTESPPAEKQTAPAESATPPAEKQTAPAEPESPPAEKPAWAYMVRCKNGSLYTGYTTNLARRLARHQNGTGAKYTRAFGGVSLAYAERLPDKRAALRREAALKKLAKAQKEALCAAFAAAERAD